MLILKSMAGALSPYRQGKARELYNIFNTLNSFSYALLAGNIITLYAMRLSASSTFIGVLNALIYWSYFFMPLGKILVRRVAIVKVFAVAWFFRAIFMIPLLFAPLAAHMGRHDAALILMLVSVFGFHFFRGVGMIGNNPVLHTLAAGPDQGSYITFIQVVTNGLSMLTSFALALLLGRNPPLALYSLIIAAGIGLGIAAAVFFYKLPEPERDAADEGQNSAPNDGVPDDGGGGKTNFFAVTKEALSQLSFRHFLLIFFTVSFVSAMARAFVVVYSREVFMQSDGMVSLYTVFGGLGALFMGLIIKFLVDRIGAKPLYITSTIMGFLSLVPPLFLMPRMLESQSTVILFLACVHFLISFGFIGAEGVAQTYFFALIPSKYMLNLGVLYYLVFGFSGGAGAFLGGLILDGLSRVFTVFVSYKILFGFLLVLLAIILFVQRKMVPLGALPFKGALEIMFSVRDLKAINLLGKLAKTYDTKEEEALLEALHEAPSQLATQGLLERSKSPRLSIRIESLKALQSLESLSEPAIKALTEDIAEHPFTTASISAHILGSHGVFTAIPLIRGQLKSRDYVLVGECMMALARLNDTESLPEIEAIIQKTKNPHIKIMGVSSLGVFASQNSLPVLLDLIRIKDPPPYLIDEVVLSLSHILDIQNLFYALLIRYREYPEMALTLAMDEAEAASEVYRASVKKLFSQRKKGGKKAEYDPAKELEKAVREYMKELNGGPLAAWILNLPPEPRHSMAQAILAETVVDGDLISLERLRLLVCQWTAHQLRMLKPRETESAR